LAGKSKTMGKVKKFFVCDETEWWFNVYGIFSQEMSHDSAEEAHEYMINGIQHRMSEISIKQLEETVQDYGFYQAMQLWTSKNPITELPMENERKFLEALVLLIVSTEFCYVDEISEDDDSDDSRSSRSEL
jgi:hypothetical protein